MKDFLKLNKSKLLFAFKFTSILCLCVCGFFLILAKFNHNQFPNTKLLIQILIVGGILFPISLLFIAYLSWENKNRIYNKYVKNKICKEVNCFGYSEKLTNQNSKWYFTEKVLSKTENGFEIQIEIVKNEIEFWIFAMNKEIEKNKLEYFEQKIGQLDFKKIFYGGFYLSLKRKKLNDNNLKETEIKLKKIDKSITRIQLQTSKIEKRSANSRFSQLQILWEVHVCVSQ
ncbi:MAG TPA: hypothetical protein VF677_10570 [Flavobacterium sp.]|jgi:hypothetical protein